MHKRCQQWVCFVESDDKIKLVMSKITEDKLTLFKKYGGDIDGYAEWGTTKEKAELSDEDFHLIDDLLQSMDMINKGVVSEDFKAKTIERIRELTDDKCFRTLTGNK
jgi:hypothetical protein